MFARDVQNVSFVSPFAWTNSYIRIHAKHLCFWYLFCSYFSRNSKDCPKRSGALYILIKSLFRKCDGVEEAVHIQHVYSGRHALHHLQRLIPSTPSVHPSASTKRSTRGKSIFGGGKRPSDERSGDPRYRCRGACAQHAETLSITVNRKSPQGLNNSISRGERR